jgi:radical SAM family uncharacterized protein
MVRAMSYLDGILARVTKPARYTGAEWNSMSKDWDSTRIKIALSYPDLYEIGMSNLGLAIIYDLLNAQPDVLAERVFAPWVDMDAEMRSHDVPLFSLESRRPVVDFDILGFSLGYELTYTNMINMLDLAGIPALAARRGDDMPLVIAGGSCALNPEPVADFIDLFFIGEAEDALPEFLDVFRRWKTAGSGRKLDLLAEAAGIGGVYVPSLYETEYHADGTFASIRPLAAEAKPSVQRRIVDMLPPPLTRPIVPYLQVVHDRGAVEIQRGCSQGCRFCQAGMMYRPVRERPMDEVIKAVGDLVKLCGYDEISLLSLSSTDYTDMARLVETLSQRYRGKNLTLSLPSLRLDTFSVALADAFKDGKKGSLTFAPEAGTERLRQAINKGISDEAIVDTVRTASERGWKGIKLYFMIGLPTETLEDVEGICRLVRNVRAIGKGRLSFRVNASIFVPKPHTPFQWEPQAAEEELAAKQQVLRAGLKRAGVQLSWQDPKVSQLEGALSRGDRRVSRVIQRAADLGCRFDAWSEHFAYDKWQQAFVDCGLDPEFFACRTRAFDEALPWGHIDTGVSVAFLRSEHERTYLGQGTPNCATTACNTCGLHLRHELCRTKYRESVGASKAGG